VRADEFAMCALFVAEAKAFMLGYASDRAVFVQRTFFVVVSGRIETF